MSLRLFMTRFYREVSVEEFHSVADALAKSGCTLLLHRANEAYFDALGVDRESSVKPIGDGIVDQTAYLLGDLVPSADWAELGYVGLRFERKGPFTLGRKTREYAKHLEVGCISTTGSEIQLRRLQQLADCALGEVHDDSNWKARNWVAGQFEDLVEKGHAKRHSFSDTDRDAARLLEDPAILELATSVKRAGGVLTGDFQELAKSQPEVAAKLLDSQLVGTTKVLICRKTSKMLARIPSSEALSELSRSGAICASCSRPFEEELVNELIVATDLAKKLIDHSNWMAAILWERLRTLGVDEDRILLEFQEGSHEVDAFVDLDGKLLMFELKDREFAMGDAYAVSGRLLKYKPDYTIVVTSKKVAPEVYEYFQQTSPETILKYVDGLKNLEPLLAQVALTVRSDRCKTILNRFQGRTLGVELERVFEARLGLSLPEKKQGFKLGSGIPSLLAGDE